MPALAKSSRSRKKSAVHRDYAGYLAYRHDRVRLPLVIVATARGEARVPELAVAAVASSACMTYLNASRTGLGKNGLHRPGSGGTALMFSESRPSRLARGWIATEAADDRAILSKEET